MPDYEKLYRILFNGITNAVLKLEQAAYGEVKEALIKAQQDAEDCYIEDDDSGPLLPLYVLPHDKYADKI